MRIFSYSIFGRLIYQYMYVPVLLIFGVQLGFSLYAMQFDKANLVPALINAAILFVIFRFYSKIRRTIPFTIELDEERIIAYNYLFSSKRIEEKISDISKIDGGIFSGKPASPVVFYFKSGEYFGVLPHLKDYTDFISLVLQKVDKKVHDEAVLRIKKAAESKTKRKKK